MISKKKILLLTVSSITVLGLASCSDKDDLMGDPNALRIEVVDGQDSVSTRAAYDGYHTDFEARTLLASIALTEVSSWAAT